MKKERKMKKYSTEWKHVRGEGWVEYDPAEEVWKIYYIEHDVEDQNKESFEE